jgi:hypothetical protein
MAAEGEAAGGQPGHDVGEERSHPIALWARPRRAKQAVQSLVPGLLGHEGAFPSQLHPGVPRQCTEHADRVDAERLDQAKGQSPPA